MIDFNVKCPKNYPLKCNLIDVEKEKLVRSEKYKVFLMYQFKEQTDYVILKVKDYFKPPLYHLFDTQEESGLGIKSCKICRLTLASDFGIASLSPLNNNVFFEVGLMQGLGKPVVYLVDRNFEHNGQRGARAVPFDLSDQMVIEHENAQELAARLEKEIPAFIAKVQLSTVYEKEFVEFVKKKIKKLCSERQKLLKFFVLEQSEELNEEQLELLLQKFGTDIKVGLMYALNDLTDVGFITRMPPKSIGHRKGAGPVFALEERYRGILKDLLFKE